MPIFDWPDYADPALAAYGRSLTFLAKNLHTIALSNVVAWPCCFTAPTPFILNTRYFSSSNA